MAVKIELKRSSVPGKVPTTESLDLGELAINTYDGLAFLKKSGSNGEEIIAIGSNTLDTGSFVTTSSFNNFTSSVTLNDAFNAFTASYNTGSFTGSFSGDFTGRLSGVADFATTASYALNVPTVDLGGYVTTSSFNAFTASYNTGSFTGSFAGDGSGLTNLNIPSQSFNTGSFVTTSSFNHFTASYNTGSFTGSFIGDGSGLTNLNIPSQSFDTGSFVPTSSFNNFTSSYNTGSFTGSFIGSLEGTASWALSASYAPGALLGGTNGYVPLWSGSTALTSSIINQYQNTQFNTPVVDINNLSYDGWSGYFVEYGLYLNLKNDLGINIIASTTSSLILDADITYGGALPLPQTWNTLQLADNTLSTVVVNDPYYANISSVVFYSQSFDGLNYVINYSSSIVPGLEFPNYIYTSIGVFAPVAHVQGDLEVSGLLYGTSSWAISSSVAISSSYATSASWSPVPSLQQVTDIGNATTNTIYALDFYTNYGTRLSDDGGVITEYQAVHPNISDNTKITFLESQATSQTYLKYPNIGSNFDRKTLATSVNGNYADSTGAITLTTIPTASYAQTASYAPNYLPLTGGTINGNVTVNGTASITFLNVTIESASVIYSSGSNILGDATNDTQTLTGTVLVSGSQQITGSLRVTDGITGSLFGTASWAVTASRAITASYATTASYVLSSSYAVSSSYTLSSSYASTSSYTVVAVTSSYPISVAGTTVYSTAPLATSTPNTNNNILIGNEAGSGSNSIGYSNFLGHRAGYRSTDAASSNFLGASAGQDAAFAAYSNFLGFSAGAGADLANDSNFLGLYAGANAAYADHSNFLGNRAGWNAENASYSNFFGYQVGSSNISSNNIIIGTNITLPNNTQDSINIGGIIFGTGSYSTTGGNPYSGSQYGIGKVGINIITPKYTLDVSGSGNYTQGLTVTGSTTSTGGFTGSLQGTASWANNALTASYVTASNVYGPYGSNSILSASYAATSSYSQQTSDVILQVINQSGAQINKGIVVRITGSNNSSDTPRIGVADYTNDNLSANTLGLVMENIANGGTGFVMTEGLFKGYDTSLWQTGQLVFLGANGAITGSAPVAPLHGVRLGQVTRVQSVNGAIYVRVDNGYELDELHDVLITNAIPGNTLVRSGSVWINSNQLTGSYGLTGSLNINNGGITGSLFGTASWASNAITASYVAASNIDGTVTSASYAATASFTPDYVLNSATSSFVTNTQTASFVLNSQTSSFVQNSQTSSFLTTSSFNSWTGSSTSQFAGTSSYATTASYALTAAGGAGGISQGQVVAIATGISNLF